VELGPSSALKEELAERGVPIRTDVTVEQLLDRVR